MATVTSFTADRSEETEARVNDVKDGVFASDFGQALVAHFSPLSLVTAHDELEDQVDTLVITGGGMSPATPTEIDTGTDNTKAVTPQGLAGLGSPSEIDRRQLKAPALAVSVGARADLGKSVAGRITVDRDLDLGGRRNLWWYTEDLTWAYYNGTATEVAEFVTVDGITLSRITTSNFYHTFSAAAGNAGYAALTAGNRYLVSAYVLSRRPVENWFWMRAVNDSVVSAHGRRLLQPNVFRRVWTVLEAASGHEFYRHLTAADYASGVVINPTFFFQGPNINGETGHDLYIGGFQVEDLGTDAKDGIAMIGDSTMEGASGNNDAGNAAEISGYLEALLNCNVYNRANGGERLDQMDTRWATDMTPLADVADLCIIQGGINDISQGRTLAQMQTSTTSMATKAATDGMVPVYLTVTPTSSIAADPDWESLRLSYNAWLKQTFAHVIDIAATVADPYSVKRIRRGDWYGDGVHYNVGAKRAIAEQIAAHPIWDTLPKPSPYQKVTATAWSSPGGDIYRNGLKVVGGRATGWAAPTGTATRTTFATDSVTTAQLAERVKALIDDLTTHGLIGT